MYDNNNGVHRNGNHHRHDEVDELDLQPVSGGKIVRGGNILKLETATDIESHGPSYIEAYPSTEMLTGDEAQFLKIRQAVYDLLEAFNVNWDDPNYTETPDRVARAYINYWANGYGRRAEDEVTVFPNSSGSGDLVLVKDMQFYSMCSHHLAPFKGHGAVAYIANDYLVGLSKLGRILDIFARRFQLQERIGAQVADKIMELLRPQGVMVVLYDVEHMCMSSRGVKLHEATTSTVATRGIFKESPQLRMEVMSLLNS